MFQIPVIKVLYYNLDNIMKNLCCQMKTQENANNLPGRRKPNCRNRLKKRVATLLHTHVALIILCTLAVLDSACVIGQIISDILIMKDELYEKELMEREAKNVLLDLFPEKLNKTNYAKTSLEDILVIVRECFRDLREQGLDRLFEKVHFDALQKKSQHKNHEENNVSVRNKRAAGENHDHHFKDPKKYHSHHILHELTHAFHLGSMVILTLLVIETIVKIMAMGIKKFLHHKIEVFDAFIVTAAWILDVVFWEGLWAHPENEAANIMIIIFPWRVVRIVNSFVLVIQEKDQVQLKIIEVRQLQSLCRRRGATDKEIQLCAPDGRSKRRRSSLLPVLTRLASVGLLGSVSSTTDLTKEAQSNDTSDEEDSTFDLNSRPSSNYSNFSSDCYSLARTMSNDSAVSTITFPSATSTENLIKDNPAFVAETPPDYKEVVETINEEEFYTKL
ncbi:hypothetical protein KUTeg_023403 [Tegillarca granosa]|uniref:Voltage-gated hydrogen channel 1 n=1 Tax=Tegillarca granosa TaxID=220873 RepID=A0ABQ9E1M4_TEGGR|nr:hypothetical protein KUTeg_023403 [Tegillarca granosa]